MAVELPPECQWLISRQAGVLACSQAAAIHIAVPEKLAPARYGKIPGVIIHRSDAIVATSHPAMAPRCTRIEDTVLDILKVTRGFATKHLRDQDHACAAAANVADYLSAHDESGHGERIGHPCSDSCPVDLRRVVPTASSRIRTPNRTGPRSGTVIAAAGFTAA
jgi:hypothetical protein